VSYDPTGNSQSLIEEVFELCGGQMMHHRTAGVWSKCKVSALEKIQQKQYHTVDSSSFHSSDQEVDREFSPDMHLQKDPRSPSTELHEKAIQFCSDFDWREGVRLYQEMYSNNINSVTPEYLEELVEIILQKISWNVSPPRSEHFLNCSLCSSVLFNPVSLECGHSFCKKCVESNSLKTCRMCDCVYEGQPFNLNVSLDAIVQYLRPTQYKASRLRTEGNHLFSVMDFENCLKKYSESISVDEESHLSLSNRAHVNSLLGKFEESLKDANRIVFLQPHWPKGHYRKGVAQLGLGRNQEAAISFFKCTMLDPSNKSVKHSLCKALHDMLLAHTLQPSDSPINSTETDLNLVINDSHPLLSFIMNCLSVPTTEEHSKDKNEGDTEIFPPAPPETVCVLCARFLYDPVTTPCGHICCLTCLNRSLDHRPFCPVCRAELHELVSMKRKNVTEILNRIIQTCWPVDYAARKEQHDEEMARLASVAQETPEEVPVFICTPAVPSVICLLHVFEPRYRLMMRQCMESGSQQFAMCAYDSHHRFARFGTMLVIREIQYLADGRSLVDSIGQRRFKVLDRGMRDGYNTAKVEWISDVLIVENEIESVKLLLHFVHAQAANWIRSLPRALQNRVEREHGSIPPVEEETLNNPNGPTWVWWIINILPMEIQKQVEFIGMTSLQSRLEELQRILFNLTNM